MFRISGQISDVRQFNNGLNITSG